MKAISLLQPWASLIVMGAKQFETRSWGTKHRGMLLIHASQSMKPVNRELNMDFQQEFFHLQIPKYEDLPFGAIIGKVYLANVFKTQVIANSLSDQEKAFGDFTYGRYAWELKQPVMFEKPIPYKGSLSLWDFPDSLLIQ